MESTKREGRTSHEMTVYYENRVKFPISHATSFRKKICIKDFLLGIEKGKARRELLRTMKKLSPLVLCFLKLFLVHVTTKSTKVPVTFIGLGQ